MFYAGVNSRSRIPGYRIQIFPFCRPHMRAMHTSWICFFASYFVQFAMAPPTCATASKMSPSDQAGYLVDQRLDDDRRCAHAIRAGIAV